MCVLHINSYQLFSSGIMYLKIFLGRRYLLLIYYITAYNVIKLKSRLIENKSTKYNIIWVRYSRIDKR